VRNLVGLEQSRSAEYDAGGFVMVVRMEIMSGAITLSLSHDPATKLAR
jgi:hypothetical protein